MLHTPLSWCCTTRQNTKGFCWVYADLDVFSSGNFFVFPASIIIFPNISTCFLLSQPSHFLTPVHTMWLCKVLEVAWLFPLYMLISGKRPKETPQSQQIARLFWGFCLQPSSLNWDSLHQIPMISLRVVMLDGSNHPDHRVSGISVKILHHPPNKFWKSKDLLLAFQLRSKHA